MKSVLQKLKTNHDSFESQGKKAGAPPGWVQYAQYLVYRKRYSVSVGDYFFNRLYDKSVSHETFFAGNHAVIHRWKNVRRKYKPEASALWCAVHGADYLVSKLLYPGLDAMDYFRYEFYNLRHAKRKTFITEGYLRRMNDRFNDERNHMDSFRILQDKAKFNTHFSEFVTRRWIKTEETSKEAFEVFCAGMDRVIAKPEDGTQGKGIFLASVSTQQERDGLFEQLRTQNYLLEEVLVQCPEIAVLNPSAVNSIRVYSVLRGEEVVITAATLRLGSGEGATDNYSAGGFAASIDTQTGIVVSRAVSQYGQSVYVHPKSKQTIIGTKIPKWEAVLDAVRRAHKMLPELRYIGWDVVVCENGTVTFLEGNTFAGVALQQHPLLEGKKPLYEKLMK